MFFLTFVIFNWASSLELRVRNKNIIFLFLNQNICCGCSKEPSQWDGSFGIETVILSTQLMERKYWQYYAKKFV